MIGISRQKRIGTKITRVEIPPLPQKNKENERKTQAYFDKLIFLCSTGEIKIFLEI